MYLEITAPLGARMVVTWAAYRELPLDAVLRSRARLLPIGDWNVLQHLARRS